MSSRTAFIILVVVDILCAVAVGVTGDLHLENTSLALGAITGILTPLLVLGFFLGAWDD